MGTLNYDSSIPLNIINLNCSGDEETVLECSFNTKGQEQCSTSSAVSVYCHGRICQSLKIVIKSLTDNHVEYFDCSNGETRLSNGTDTMQGRVEMCYNNVWYGLCADNYNSYFLAATTCKSLGIEINGRITRCDFSSLEFL